MIQMAYVKEISKAFPLYIRSECLDLRPLKPSEDKAKPLLINLPAPLAYTLCDYHHEVMQRKTLVKQLEGLKL